MTVAEVGRRMTSGELVEWSMFERDFGPITVHERIDATAAIVAQTVAQASGLKRANGTDPEVSDFLPEWGPDRTGEVTDWLKAMAS